MKKKRFKGVWIITAVAVAIGIFIFFGCNPAGDPLVRSYGGSSPVGDYIIIEINEED